MWSYLPNFSFQLPESTSWVLHNSDYHGECDKHTKFCGLLLNSSALVSMIKCIYFIQPLNHPSTKADSVFENSLHIISHAFSAYPGRCLPFLTHPFAKPVSSCLWNSAPNGKLRISALRSCFSPFLRKCLFYLSLHWSYAFEGYRKYGKNAALRTLTEWLKRTSRELQSCQKATYFICNQSKWWYQRCTKSPYTDFS